MSTIVTRTGKGSALTWAEADANVTNLNTDKAEYTTLAASGGSNLVGFLQAGTGAVSTTTQTKQRESVSVKDFGAVGDGVADDTTSIQAALDYLASRPVNTMIGGKLYFPAGHYKITSTLNINKEMVIEGEGTRAAKIVLTTSGFAFIVNSPHVVIKNLYFIDINTGISSGIKLNTASNCIIDRCTFTSLVVSVELYDSYAVEIIGCIFSLCATYSIRSTTKCNNLIIERNGFFGCGVTNTGHAVSLNTGSETVRIVGNDFEECYVNIRLNNFSAVAITDNYFDYTVYKTFDFIGTCYGINIDRNFFGAGAAETFYNIVGGSFTGNVLWNQTTSFDSATLRGFTVGVNNQTGTGTLGTSPWITATLLNSWAAGGSFSIPGYILEEDGWVHLRGQASGGTVPNVCFVLPAAYRPAKVLNFETAGPNGACWIEVHPGGNVTPLVAASNTLGLDGISFKIT